jgi:hypothetical protein
VTRFGCRLGASLGCRTCLGLGALGIQGYYQANRAKALGYQQSFQRRRRAEIKAQLFGHYGTTCACCGTTERLTIDHVNGGGAGHREALFGSRGVGAQFWYWLIRQGFPPGYQTLCASCNSSKGNGGRCRLAHGGQR